MGLSANIFSNHLWTWGDQRTELILGWDRASRMDAARSALRAGVPISLYCDTPVTALDPLMRVKHAVTRLPPPGRVLGEYGDPYAVKPEKLGLIRAAGTMLGARIMQSNTEEPLDGEVVRSREPPRPEEPEGAISRGPGALGGRNPAHGP